MKNQTILFDSVPPYAGPVHVADLLTGIEAVIKKHVILNDHAAAALAVWVLHTYTFQLRDAVAYVAIESPEKRCGKTTLISVLAAMAHKPLIASNITVGALFRAIDTCRPTLFIDEADTFLARNSAMRGIINSGNTWRTAYVLRLSSSKTRRGDPPPPPALQAAEPGLKRYSCWCPKVIALIGEIPDTIADRSIVVKMARKLVTEPCAPLAELDTAEIKAKCARFALDAGPSIAQSDKIRGEGLNDRAADTFDPLYVIARQAGDDWEKKLHAAALALNATTPFDNRGTEVLLDVLSVIAESGYDRMFSRDLVAGLRDGSAGLSSFALKGSAIDEYKIAKLLRPYGIKPSTFRMGTQVYRGYIAADFHQALERYVPQAEVEACAEELTRRIRLQEEAKKEAEKEAAQRENERADEGEIRAAEMLPEAPAALSTLKSS
jgi:hypothetical protein